MVLFSVSKILTFTFRLLVISGVSCYSCLWLELVPLVILLASISRPGRLDLSSEFQWSEQSLQASSPLFREGAQLSGVWTSSWLKMKAQNRIFPRSCVALARKVASCLEPKMALPQKLCGSRLSQKLLASVFHTLTHAACPPQSPEPRWLLRSLRQKTLGPGRPLCSHQEGGRLSVAENGADSQCFLSNVI